MDEEIETQKLTERGAEGPLPSTELPTSTRLELHRLPTEVLLGGDGYSTWISSVKKMFLSFNQEQRSEPSKMTTKRVCLKSSVRMADRSKEKTTELTQRYQLMT
ncbi:hypothetical protein XENORESO_022079 [Xenotaenia resolanae]|uniref:Uncharacterized protein n=1 Tax=Xenotaenia resolanae TaxID=208358 RepID=A0ABV0W467_9TELE